MRIEGLWHNLGSVLLFPGFPISFIGLVALPWQARGRTLRPLLLLSLITFLVTSLVFPVATTWGTFLHAAGPFHVLLVISALLALDAGSPASRGAHELDPSSRLARGDARDLLESSSSPPRSCRRSEAARGPRQRLYAGTECQDGGHRAADRRSDGSADQQFPDLGRRDPGRIHVGPAGRAGGRRPGPRPNLRRSYPRPDESREQVLARGAGARCPTSRLLPATGSGRMDRAGRRPSRGRTVYEIVCP